jgi:hypothetical protein
MLRKMNVEKTKRVERKMNVESSNCVGKCCGVFSLLGKRVCMFLEKERGGGGFGLD